METRMGTASAKIQVGFVNAPITMVFDDKPMAEVKLENCQHGTDGCFVSKGDVRQVAER